MKKKTLCLFLLGSLGIGMTHVQAESAGKTSFRHLDVAVSAGTTGIGVDVATPICKVVQMRAGFSFFPREEISSVFRVEVGDPEYDQTTGQKIDKFSEMSEKLERFTGFHVDDKVVMELKPTMYNASLLFDVFPIPDNDHWYVTAGVYYGHEKIGEAVNGTKDMVTLVSVAYYNNLRTQALSETGIGAYLSPDYIEKLYNYGDMYVPLGKYKHDGVAADGTPYVKGDTYRMYPDEDCTVSAKMKVNKFKPYVGLGFKNDFGYQDRFAVSVDAGVMFWGGAPDVYTHDGTNLTRDVEDIYGKVGRYMDVASAMKVFPVLNARISYRIF